MDFILERLNPLGEVSAKKMFGEYGVYYEGKMIALVSDDQLFVKPSESGRTFIGDPEEAPPYPGAKNWFYISEEKWEDANWLQKLILVIQSLLSNVINQDIYNDTKMQLRHHSGAQMHKPSFPSFA
jgi:TfoX/Sxy family transcriptional regulator of competence genes